LDRHVAVRPQEINQRFTLRSAVMDLLAPPPRSVRLAAVGLWLRAGLHLLAPAFGLLAAYRPKPSDAWFTSWWWYLQEADGWVWLFASGMGDWIELLAAGFVALSVLYAVVGARVWRGGRTACRLATVLMALGAAQSLYVLYLSFHVVADRDQSVMPFGSGPIADWLAAPTLLLWPLALLGLAISVVFLANTPAAREYPAASDRAVSAALLAWRDSFHGRGHRPRP
jgi:hypothetical protein